MPYSILLTLPIKGRVSAAVSHGEGGAVMYIVYVGSKAALHPKQSAARPQGHQVYYVRSASEASAIAYAYSCAGQ